MSAEIMREAASKMRERAEAARAGRWVVCSSDLAEGTTLIVAEWQSDVRRVATCAGSLPEGNADNAEYIASMSPTVSFLVADWLDATVRRYEFGWELGETPEVDPAALAVARAYLGSDR